MVRRRSISNMIFRTRIIWDADLSGVLSNQGWLSTIVFSTRGRAWALALAGCRLELIQPVERRDFVGFGKSGIVENRIAEIFDGSTHREHRLPDMHDLRGPVADDVHPQ